MIVDLQCAPTGVLFDDIVIVSKGERLSFSAQLELFNRPALNPGSWFGVAGKPGGPYLYGHTLRIVVTTGAAGVQEQIAKPPGAAAVSKRQANKPHFITAAS